MAEKLKPQPIKKTDIVDSLIEKLNQIESVIAWKSTQSYPFQIIVSKKIYRTTIDIVNASGFNPYEKKVEEAVNKVFIIELDDSDKMSDPLREMYTSKGITYIKSTDLGLIVTSIEDFA